MRRMREGGYIVWEALLVLSLAGILLAAAVPRGVRCYQAAAVEYETLCLLDDLRRTQNEARTMVESIYGISDSLTKSDPSYRRQLQVQGDGYKVYGKPEKVLRRHRCLPGVKVSLSHANGGGSVRFYNNGLPDNNCTITVSYQEKDGVVREWRKIYINPAGRIRAVVASP